MQSDQFGFKLKSVIKLNQFEWCIDIIRAHKCI